MKNKVEDRNNNSKKKSQSKKYAIIGAVIVIVAVIAGVISYSGSNTAKSSSLTLTTPPNIGSAAQSLQIGDSAPDFTLTDPQQGTITKETFMGKPLFIFFTATYCTPCQIGAQNLDKYYDDTGGKAFNVLIVFVDPSESNSQFVDWKSKYGRDNWYIAQGVNMAVNYKVQYLDTKYVLDKNGIIKWVNVNPLEYQTAKQVLESL